MAAVADCSAMSEPKDNPQADKPMDYDAMARQLSSWWRDGIPLVAAMGVEIETLDQHGLTLTAAAALNRNHMGTGFGGSLQALATLAGWGICILSLQDVADTRVVIRRSQMEFLTPVRGVLRAHCPWPDAPALRVFRNTVSRRGRSRLELTVTLPGDGRPAAVCEGVFVAIRDDLV